MIIFFPIEMYIKYTSFLYMRVKEKQLTSMTLLLCIIIEIMNSCV